MNRSKKLESARRARERRATATLWMRPKVETPAKVEETSEVSSIKEEDAIVAPAELEHVTLEEVDETPFFKLGGDLNVVETPVEVLENVVGEEKPEISEDVTEEETKLKRRRKKSTKDEEELNEDMDALL